MKKTATKFRVETAETIGNMTTAQRKAFCDGVCPREFGTHENAKEYLSKIEKMHSDVLFEIVEYEYNDDGDVVDYTYREQSTMRKLKINVDFFKAQGLNFMKTIYNIKNINARLIEHHANHSFTMNYKVEKDLLKIADTLNVSIEEIVKEV